MKHITEGNAVSWLEDLAGPGWCSAHKVSTSNQKSNKNLDLELLESVKVSCKGSSTPVILRPGTELAIFRSPRTNAAGKVIAVALPPCRTFQVKFMTGYKILYTDLTRDRSTPRRSPSMRVFDE